MAEATKSTRTVTTTEETYTLTLTPAEYRYLHGLIGEQPFGAGDGASGAIWDALKAPSETQERPLRKGDRVTVLPDARCANGASLTFTGPATISNGPDSDGDYFVMSTDSIRGGYVLPEYLRRA